VILVLGAATSIIGYLAIMWVHEQRAVKRNDAAIERHAQVVKDLAHDRALTLAAISQRIAIEHDIVVIKSALSEIEGRLETLEEHCSDNNTRS
jgi:hypothetical protein